MMTYRIYRLRFHSAVHFGSDSGSEHVSSAASGFRSDTLFSALCLEALQYGGEAWLQDLVSWSRDGSLVLSDLFPYSGNTYFLLKPKKLYARKQQDSAVSVDRKLVKKLTHISADSFEEYIAYQRGECDTFDMASVVEKLHGMITQERRMSAALRHTDAEPYYIGDVRFADGCGLYAIVGSEHPERLDNLFASLEMTGIGGRKTQGLGKFTCEVVELNEQSDYGLDVLYRRLTAQNAKVFMTLNTSLPKEEELGCLTDAAYLLTRRGGMVNGSAIQHKQTVYALEAGSCVSKRYAGQVLDVRMNQDQGHPIYRNLTPMFMEVE